MATDPTFWEHLRAAVAGADAEAALWSRYGVRRAVLFTDLEGFSHHVAHHGVVHFLWLVDAMRRVLGAIAEVHHGRVLKAEADSLMVVFESAPDALRCAFAMNEACDAFNREREARDHLRLCVGIGFGDVLRVGDDDVFGIEVNAASKLGEDTARAREVLVTDATRKACATMDGVGWFEIPVGLPGSARNWRAVPAP
jgi:class 3 adenylate cyclase